MLAWRALSEIRLLINFGWLLSPTIAPFADAAEKRFASRTLTNARWAHGSSSVALDDSKVGCSRRHGILTGLMA